MAAIVQNMPHCPFSDHKRIGKQLAVTAPGHRFGAHVATRSALATKGKGTGWLFKTLTGAN